MEYYNRYKHLVKNNENMIMPKITLAYSSMDKQVVFKKGVTRFDKLSQEYYGNPLHGFLISVANPHIDGMEFDIEEGTVIRIPYPFESALTLYNNAINEYIYLEGK